ncbi:MULTISPECIES: hypothetical protein [Niastella]|uniref:Uncharacterized protein n=1 Tax=Niastella soli TaxID=2821487 RepID=A0ABS3YVF4_9BACT|nr:hypothetical protein [Niastella soli]MBO9201843.1 hypothetical protein [Niastella soli]
MRTLLLIILCLITSQLFSQEKQLEQAIGWKGNAIEIHTVSDNAKQQCGLLVANEDSIRVSWINSNKQVVKQFAMARGLEEPLLGGFIKEGKMYLYNQNPEAPVVRAWKLDSATGDVTESGIPLDFKDENLVSAVNCGDHFVYVNINPKNAELLVHDFANEHEYATLRYHFDPELWRKLIKTANIKKGLQVGNIEVEGEGNLPLSACANKIYSRNDTLLLLMNNELKETSVYCFDLKNKQVTTRGVSHFAGFPYKSSDDAVDNSFLVQDKLLYVRVSKDSMGIQILNFYTGATLTTFKASAKEVLGFKNSLIFSEPFIEGDRLPETDQLYRKILRNYPLIMAMPTNNNQLAITIGSSSITNTVARGHNFIPVPLLIPGMFPLHLLMLPVAAGPKKVVPETNYFTMLIDAGSGEHVKGAPPTILSKEIEQFSKDLKRPPLGETLFMINGGYYYAYYDKKGRKVVILKL